MSLDGEFKTHKENEDPLILENYKYEDLTKENHDDDKFLNLIETQIEEKISMVNEEIPIHIKILFSLPSFSKMSCLLVLNVHALIFYESKGSSLLLISFFTALARCIEIILKPLIAHWSDNSKFALGRRKPFMVFGCGFYAIFLILIFSLPAKLISPISTAIWFGSFYVFFFIADTVCNIPYQALGPELSPDTKERERLYVVFYFFQYIGVLFASVAPVIIQHILSDTCDCSKCDSIIWADKKEQCIAECKAACGVDNNELSLLIMCMFVGLFFVVSIIVLSHVIKERKIPSVNREESHLVPTLFRMINNEPFIRLLVPWILDATISQIFATMLPFFVTFVVNPQNYCIKNKIEASSFVCNVNDWIGLTIFVFFIFVICFMGLWHWIIQYTGKKKAWQAYSLISIVTFSLFLFCDEGMMILLVGLSVVNAFPAGAGYLTDVFVSDSIDYDEFVTGKRNEGIYTVFSSFTPKIVGLFAQSIPLTVLSLIGFIPSSNGRNFDQPFVVKEFIRFYFIAIPVLLALISFICKIKYPIDSDKKMNRLKSIIKIQNENYARLAEHNDFYKIKNPIYERDHIQIFTKTKNQINSKIVADHFYDIEYLLLIQKGNYTGIKNRLIWILITLMILTISFTVCLIYTFKFLEVKSLSLIPLISLFIITISLCFIIINYMRLRIINKVISGEYILDDKYIALYIYQLNLAKFKDEDVNCEDCGKLKN